MAQPAWYAVRVRKSEESKGEPYCGFGTSTVAGDEFSILRFVVHGTLLGRRVEAQPVVAILALCLAGLSYLALWSLLPRPLMERGGSVLDPLATWFLSSVVGGSLCTIFGIPAQMGIQWAAVIWANIPHFGYFTAGIVPRVRYTASRLGLTMVIARAGFAIHLRDVKSKWQRVVLLSFLPLLGEATAHALLAQRVFHFPDYRWAFLQGFLTSAVAPGIVVPGLLMLRQEGIGETGPGSTIMGSCVFDSVFAIWMVSFLADLIFGDKPVGLAIALGPIQLLGGFLVGLLLAFPFHWTVRLFLSEYAQVRDANGALHYPPNHLSKMHFKVVGLFSGVAIALIFLGERLHLFGGGCIAVLGFSGTVSQLWAPQDAEPKPPQELPASPPLTPVPMVRAPSPIAEIAVAIDATQTEFAVGEPLQAPTNEPTSTIDDPDRSTSLRIGPYAGGRPASNSEPVISPNEPTDNIPSEGARCREKFFVTQRGLLFQEYAWLWDNLVMPALFAFSGTTVRLSAVFGADFFPKAIGVLLLGVFVRWLLAIPAGVEHGVSRWAAVYVGFAWIGKATVQSALGGIALDNIASMETVPAGWQAAAVTIQQMALLGAILFAPINAVLTVALGRLWLPRSKSEATR